MCIFCTACTPKRTDIYLQPHPPVTVNVDCTRPPPQDYTRQPPAYNNLRNNFPLSNVSTDPGKKYTKAAYNYLFDALNALFMNSKSVWENIAYCIEL